jgi:hypothetical protein
LNRAKRLRPSVTAVVLDLVILLGLMCPEKICRAVIVSTSMLTMSDLGKLIVVDVKIMNVIENPNSEIFLTATIGADWSPASRLRELQFLSKNLSSAPRENTEQSLFKSMRE